MLVLIRTKEDNEYAAGKRNIRDLKVFQKTKETDIKSSGLQNYHSHLSFVSLPIKALILQ